MATTKILKKHFDYEIIEAKKTPETALRASASGMTSAASLGKVSSLPPALETTASYSHTYAFSSTTSSAVIVTTQDLFPAFGFVATNSTLGTCIVSSYRVRAIRVWPSPQASATETAQLAWANPLVEGDEKDTNVIRPLPGGITVTAGVKYVPPKGTLASQWINTATNNNYFTLIAPVRSIIYLDVDVTLSSQLAPLNVNSGYTSLSTGVLYYAGLDGPGASPSYPPIGLPNGT